jgi:replicative DNA helicase
MSAENLKVIGAVSGGLREDPRYRVIPHNEEVEQALLGALLVNNRALEKVAEFLRPEHFYMPVHGRIYEAISKFIERGQDASPATLKNFFDRDADLESLGGGQYLAELAAHVVSVVNVEDYGCTIYEAHIRRALIALGEDVVNEAYDHKVDLPPRLQIEDAERRLFDLATIGEIKGGFIGFSVALKKAIEQAQQAYAREGLVTGVTTGLIDMDKKLGGLQKSDLLILAGRPAMGKTALATNIAVSAARAYADSQGKEGAVVAFFSLEMSSEQLATRILADLSGVPSDNIRRGEVRDTDFHKFVEASQQLSNMPLFIDDTPALTISAIRTRARRLKRQNNNALGLIVVDYLQLIQGSGRGTAGENRVLEISEITRGLKTIAKELEVPVLALSQLSRAVESRDNKRPMLSDLRESGSIEQDADVVMFVYREEYYLKNNAPQQKPEETSERFNERHTAWMQAMERVHNVAECIISKQRHGPTGTVPLFFDGEFTRFSNLESSRAQALENVNHE